MQNMNTIVHEPAVSPCDLWNWRDWQIEHLLSLGMSEEEIQEELEKEPEFDWYFLGEIYE